MFSVAIETMTHPKFWSLDIETPVSVSTCTTDKNKQQNFALKTTTITRHRPSATEDRTPKFPTHAYTQCCAFHIHVYGVTYEKHPFIVRDTYVYSMCAEKKIDIERFFPNSCIRFLYVNYWKISLAWLFLLEKNIIYWEKSIKNWWKLWETCRGQQV